MKQVLSEKENTFQTSNSFIKENENLQEVLKDFILINNAFHSVELVSAS